MTQLKATPKQRRKGGGLSGEEGGDLERVGAPWGWVGQSCPPSPRTCGRAEACGQLGDGHSRSRCWAVLGFWGEGPHLGALVLALPNQFPELVPEEHAEDGVGAQAQVGGAQTLVECQGALLPPDLHQAVGETPVQLALGTDKGWASLQGFGALAGTSGYVCV